MRRGGIAGILLKHGEAIARLKQIGLYVKRLMIVAAGGVEVSFDQVKKL